MLRELALKLDLEPSLREIAIKAIESRIVIPDEPDTQPTVFSEKVLFSRAAQRVALKHTFTTEEVHDDPSVLRSLLQASSTVFVGGQRRLRLAPAARAKLISALEGTPGFAELLKEATGTEGSEPAVSEQPSIWLRRFLMGDVEPLRRASAEDLSAAVAAREALEFVDLPKSVVDVAELRRMQELAELLEPLRILIGADPATGSDRFVGRVAEIRELRGFVDELASESASELITRGIKRAARSISNVVSSRAAGVYTLVARGGLGKSSLIAKFVLDHALNQRRQFPFAYLDFDRASLQPRDPRHLLSETARQVALQFPRLTGPIAELRAGVQADLQSSGSTQRDHFGWFRDRIRRDVLREGQAFLLILDTMELVQYDQVALDGVAGFLDSLIGPGFPELKIVAVGRAEISELMRQSSAGAEGTRHDLKALSVTEARDMANRLGTALIGSEWRDGWGARIAGSSRDPDMRREPLSIRVAVEVLRGIASDAERERMVATIAELGEAADGAFVAVLYQRRVLDYVKNEEARRLAWPGLLLRRLTKEIVRDVLAKPCELSAEQAGRAFDALSREVWIVDRDGEALRHRRDLRARTLPLMRRYDPALFDGINRAAIAYFETRADQNPERAEWIYHRLLGGEDPRMVERDWSDEIVPYLPGAADDFGELFPRAAQYLLARTEQRLMSRERLAKLDTDLAYDHIARVAPRLGRFNEERCEAAVLEVVRRPRSDGALSASGAALRTVLGVKSGRWRAEDLVSGGATGQWAEMCRFALKYKRARTFSSARPDEIEVELRDELDRSRWANASSSLRNEVAHRDLTQDLALARFLNLTVADEIEKLLTESWGWRRILERVDLESLRLATCVCRRPREAMSRWLSARREFPRSSSPRSVCASELAILAEISYETVERAVEPELRRLGRKLRDFTEERMEFVAPLRIEDDALALKVDGVVGELLAQEDGLPLSALRRYFRVHDGDWVIPFGYAVARRDLSPASRALRHLRGAGAASKSAASDPILLLRAADQAADLTAVVEEYVKAAGAESEASQDLRGLFDHFRAWTRAKNSLFDGKSAPRPSGAGDKPPEPGPITVHRDLQKSRWGGSPDRDGRRLSAVLDEVRQNLFFVDLIVESTDGSPLDSPVLFHLHDTYLPHIIHIRRIRDGSRAVLEEVSATGIYTVGAQVRARDGKWTSLELDLATLPDLPSRFLSR